LDCEAEASLVPPIHPHVVSYVVVRFLLCFVLFFSVWLEDGGVCVLRFWLNQKVVFTMVVRTTVDLHFWCLVGCFRK